MALRNKQCGSEVTAGSAEAWKTASRLLGAKKLVACRVLGGSMSPFLSHDDVIWLRPITAAELRFGDVVLYAHDDRRIVHRFLGRKQLDGREVLVIKGDAIRHFDPPVLPSQVLARVVRVEKAALTLTLESTAGKLLNFGMGVLCSCPGPGPLGVARAIRRVIK